MDFYLFQQINQWAGKWIWLDTIGIFFAKYFGYILIAVVFLLLIKNRKKYFPMVMIGFTSAIFARFGLVGLIRWMWDRPRPFVENHVNLLFDKFNQPAFPSGHAAFFFALSLGVYFYNKKAGLLFFVASFLISFARVFSGIHWPFDIIAGILVGIFSGWLVYSLFMKLSRR